MNWFHKTNNPNLTPIFSNVSYTSNEVNSYTSIKTGMVVVDRRHGMNGNLTFDGKRRYLYDSNNRLKSVWEELDSNAGTEELFIAGYKYDALGRRIGKLLADDKKVCYYYDGAQVIEERDETDTLLAAYIYGVEIDEPLELTLSYP